MHDGKTRIMSEPGVKEMVESNLQGLSDNWITPQLREIVRQEVER